MKKPKYPTIMEESASREPFRAKWWRTNIAQMTPHAPAKDSLDIFGDIYSYLQRDLHRSVCQSKKIYNSRDALKQIIDR
jgi:hypothetical protein